MAHRKERALRRPRSSPRTTTLVGLYAASIGLYANLVRGDENACEGEHMLLASGLDRIFDLGAVALAGTLSASTTPPRNRA